MRIRLLMLLPFFYISFLVHAQNSELECYQDINANDVKLMIETKDVLIIDVSLNKEYRKERIENAFLASSVVALKDLVEFSNKDQIIIVYCQEGSRSKVAAQILCNNLNFKKVFNLKGGINAWKKKGYYVDSKRVKSSIN